MTTPCLSELPRIGLLAAVAAFGAAAPAAAAAADRAELLVPQGKVAYVGGKLSGSFVVRDTGQAVGRTSATLGVRVATRRVLIARVTVPALRRGATRRLVVRGRLPAGLPIGTRTLTVCADAGRRVRERSESNNCRGVLTLLIGRPSAGAAPAAGMPQPPPTIGATPAGPPPASGAASTVPSDPISFRKETVLEVQGPMAPYWVYVPAGYDASHATPTTLFVWLHGCGERSPEVIAGPSPGGSQSWITVAPGGRESGCWNPTTDMPLVLSVIADVKRHFNIAARRVVLGGFSSGGDLAYRTIYENANLFAGLLAEGTTPFAGTGCPSRATCIERAARKVNIVHLAHTDDDAYPLGTVRPETDALRDAGFPITRIERPGGHSEPDSGDTGTVHDLRTYLLPHLSDPWLAPAS